MKKAFHIILIYLLVCVFGTAALAALFMFNQDMLSYVTDVPSKLFSLQSFLYGASVSFPLTASAALFAVILLMVRNRKKQILSLVIFVCLAAATWIFLIPLSLDFLSDLESENKIQNFQSQTTSTGIFRENESGVFYNSRILENGNADGIFIDTSGLSENEEKIIKFYDSPVNNNEAYPYSDILVKDALEPPKYVTYPLEVYTSLLTAAENSRHFGFFAWLFFASFGLALAATYGLQFLSSWRLCSALSVATGQILIVFINYFYYMGFFPSGLKQLESLISENLPFSIENSLILAVNLLISLILVAFGIVMGIYRARKANLSENGEN